MQTRGELLWGALYAAWGEARMATLRQQLSDTATIPVDAPLTDTYAELTARLKKSGHPLHDKPHTGDRWIAATAVHHGLPLLTGDGIYRDVPGLSLL
jgi:predicted nucleic acid-binding protein